ncbi:MAG: hypothetical protein Q9187_005263 [Circinaria calcarea]
MAAEGSVKRRRLSLSGEVYLKPDEISTAPYDHLDAATPYEENSYNANKVLTRPISPPSTKRKHLSDAVEIEHARRNIINSQAANDGRKVSGPRSIPSSIQLSHVEGLSSANNVDTVSLRDILGDPLIKECWVFNYLFDVNFLMSQFDEDVRDSVRVKIVHGSWKNEDSNKLHIDEAATQLMNVQVITAYMPEAYGTHHSKMVILIRHDDQAQVNILTANMVPGDWRMCQAVWRSPLLPLQGRIDPNTTTSTSLPTIGTGSRFKHDLLAYLRSYGQAKLGALTAQLKQYDFNTIRAALVASTPGKQNLRSTDPDKESVWGWPGLKSILKCIPSDSAKRPAIVIQVSSVASLGGGDKWLTTTLLDTLATGREPKVHGKPKPQFSLIFPTADEIRRSLNGYGSGASIHMKTQSAAQVKQLDYLRPMLCHWAGDGATQPTASSSLTAGIREAGRRRAAPHIKTYIRFSDNSMTKIDWAMVTSANLSTQAWGAATNPAGEVRICSYEIGVVVWPALWDDGVEGSAEMVPVFKKDLPDELQTDECDTREDGVKTRVGVRMPYDLPLVPYRDDEMPWCATAPDSEPDWMGRVWPGFGMH